MKIYVASSWRNKYQPGVVSFLRNLEHEVYDFRNPKEGNNGFHWSEIYSKWEEWTTQQYIEGLKSPLAEESFENDITNLNTCNACVLVLPCGKSSHLELGYAIGQDKRTVIYAPEKHTTPELMYKMTSIVDTLPDIQYNLFDGHSMGRFLPCGACGDMEGCSYWNRSSGNQFDRRKYETST